MKNIIKPFNIDKSSYIFILICFLCGYFKYVTGLYIILFIHELGHIFFIKLFKYKIKLISIYPYGGKTIIDKDINTSINKELCIALGGIISQLILKLILFYYKDYLIDYKVWNLYNNVIILFNLLPIIPLDGSNILRLILEKILPYEKSLKYIIIISILFLFIFILYNILYIKNIFMCFILIYNLIIFRKNYYYLVNRFYLERYLHNYEYKKIINESICDYHRLKKEKKHFFYKDGKYMDEHDILKDRFTKYYMG